MPQNGLLVRRRHGAVARRAQREVKNVRAGFVPTELCRSFFLKSRLRKKKRLLRFASASGAMADAPKLGAVKKVSGPVVVATNMAGASPQQWCKRRSCKMGFFGRPVAVGRLPGCMRPSRHA
jgi:hypothetical protein